MQGSRIVLLATAVTLSGTVVLESLQRQRDVDVMASAAADFLASLSSEQHEQVTFGFDSEERSRHHFIPPEVFERHGLVYRAMTSEQKVRALDLLRSGLSQQGYLTAQQIMEVEGILGVIVEGEGRQFARDQDAYWVSVFGTPTAGTTWGWRWEGHHLSLHFTLVDGAMTALLPRQKVESVPYAVEAARLNSQEAIQIHGGNGFTWEYDLHRYLKRAMTLDQFSGRTGQLLELAYQAVAAGLPATRASASKSVNTPGGSDSRARRSDSPTAVDESDCVTCSAVDPPSGPTRTRADPGPSVRRSATQSR